MISDFGRHLRQYGRSPLTERSPPAGATPDRPHHGNRKVQAGPDSAPSQAAFRAPAPTGLMPLPITPYSNPAQGHLSALSPSGLESSWQKEMVPSSPPPLRCLAWCRHRVGLGKHPGPYKCIDCTRMLYVYKQVVICTQWVFKKCSFSYTCMHIYVHVLYIQTHLYV